MCKRWAKRDTQKRAFRQEEPARYVLLVLALCFESMVAQATTLELADGTTELVGFFGGLFGVTHLPASDPVGRVLICSPLHSEFLKNNRREVLLGRRLAAAGFAAQRFHYRGTGNSFGDASALTIETMAADASTAIDHLVDVAGTGRVDVVATRLASLAATAVAAPDSRVVLWEPVDDGKRYFRELTRTLLILGVKHGGGRTAAELEEEFISVGSLDVAGFSVTRGLRDSSMRRTLDIGIGTGPVLIAQLGRSLDVRRDIATVIAVATAAGRPTTVQPIGYEEAWWFHQDVDLLRPEESGALDNALVDLTSSWLEEGGP
jgi:hypothetical protein